MLMPAQVWLVVDPVDMRLGIDGLSAHIQQALDHTPVPSHCDSLSREPRRLRKA